MAHFVSEFRDNDLLTLKWQSELFGLFGIYVPCELCRYFRSSVHNNPNDTYRHCQADSVSWSWRLTYWPKIPRPFTVVMGTRCTKFQLSPRLSFPQLPTLKQQTDRRWAHNSHALKSKLLEIYQFFYTIQYFSILYKIRRIKVTHSIITDDVSYSVPVGEQSNLVSVCLCVRLSASISLERLDWSSGSLLCRSPVPWLSPPLTALRYGGRVWCLWMPWRQNCCLF